MKRLRRTLVAVPSVLAALLFLIWALRGVLIEPRLKTFIVSTVGSALGLEIEIGDIRGSYLSSLVLQDVRTVREGTSGPLTSVDAEKIRARYSLLSLISGLEAFLGRFRVDIDGAEVRLHLGEDEGKPEPDDPDGGPLELPAVLPEVSIRDSFVSLKGSGFGFRAGGIRLFVKAGAGKDTSRIDIGIAGFNLDHPSVRDGEVSLGAVLVYDGAGVTIESVDVERERVVQSGRAELSGLPGAFSAEVQTRLFSRRLDARCAFDGSMIEANLTAGETDLGELFSVILLPAVELDGTLSAEAAVLIDTKNLPGLEGSLSVDWKNARYDAFSADLLEGQASAREGILVVESLKGRSEENVADLSGFSLSLDALFDGEWDLLVDSLAGAFSLHLADLPGLLSQGNLSVPGMKGDAPPHRIDLEGKMGGRTLSFSEGKLEVDGGRVELEPSAISLPGAGEGWGEAALDIELVADLPDLSVLNELFPLPELSGSLGGVVSLHGSFGAPSGKVDVEASALAVDERAVGDLILKGEGDGRLLTVHRAELHTAGEAGDVEVRELSLPAKELFAGEWKGLLQEFAGRIQVKTSNIPALLAAFGQDSPGKDVPAHSLDLQGETGGGRIAISQGVFESEPGRFTIEKGEVSFPRPGMEWSETVLDLSMRTDVPDLGRAGEIFGFPGLGGVIAGDLTLSGAISTLRGSAALEGSALSFRDLPPGDLSLKGSVDRGSVSITSLELTREQDLLTASGAFDLADRIFRDVSFNAAINDLSDYLAGPEGLVRGTALEGNVEIGGTLSALEGSVKITADSAAGSASLSGDLQVSPDEGRYSLLMRELSLTREEVGLELTHPATFAWFSPEGFSVKDFSLDGGAGTILIDGTMSPEGDTALVLKISDLTGEGWLEEFAGDRFTFSGADLEVQASGSLERPSLSLTGTVAEFLGRGAPFPLSGALDAGYSSEGIEIRTFSWEAPTGKAVNVTGTLPLDPLADEALLPTELSLAVRLDIPDLREIAFLLPEGYGVDGKLEGDADLSGTWERPSGEARIRIADLSFPEKLRPAPPGKLSVDCRLEAVSGEFTLREVQIDSPVISANASGSWTGVPVLIDVARGEAELLQGDVSLEGTLEASELGWVSRGVDALRSAAGVLTATLSLEGPVGAPEVTLEADLEDLGLRFRGAPPVQEVNGELSLKEGTLSIPGLEGDLGGAPFELSGTLTGIGGEELDFDLKLTGDGLLLYRDQGVRVRADADLAARGPLSKLGLSGSVMITDSRYVKNIDLLGSVGGHKAPTVRRGGALFSFRDPPLRDLVFDIRLGAKDPFIVRNQFIRGSATPSLRLTGTGEEPVLEGRVTIDKFRAQLPTGVLRGEQGLVVFREGEPARPWLEVLGEGRMMGYDITMQITGFADEPRIVLSSSPPLPGDEILLMVLAGTPPRSSDTAAAASTGAALSLFLARSFLSRWFGGDPEATDEMLLDRLETQVGRDITEKGDPTIDISLQLREQFLLKGGSLYLTGEKDRYDDSNYGVRFGLDFLNKGEE